MNFPNNSFFRHIGLGWHAVHAVKYGISGLLHLETTCIRSALLEKWLQILPWFSWSRYKVFFFAWITFLCAVWLGILAGNQFRICVSTVRSQFGQWYTYLKYIPEFMVDQDSFWNETLTTNKSPATGWKHIELDCTVPYCIVLYTWLPAEMHQAQFWSYSSFQWVNNSWSSRK